MLLKAWFETALLKTSTSVKGLRSSAEQMIQMLRGSSLNPAEKAELMLGLDGEEGF